MTSKSAAAMDRPMTGCVVLWMALIVSAVYGRSGCGSAGDTAACAMEKLLDCIAWLADSEASMSSASVQYLRDPCAMLLYHIGALYRLH